MLTPQQLEHVPEGMLALWAQVEADILADMAIRINAYDMFISATEHQFRALQEMGLMRDDIIARLVQVTGKSEIELREIIGDATLKSLKKDDAIYRRAGLHPPPLRASPMIQATLAAGLRNAQGLFDNLTRTTAQTATKQFEHALDRAWMQVTSGAFSHTEATRSAIKELASKGIAAIEYPSGHVDHLDVAVRRAVLTGVNQAVLNAQEARADEMGCDLVEVTAHAGARTGDGIANHAEWQGKVYSRKGESRRYPNFAKATGYGTGEGLGGWNCRHTFYPFFEGISEPVYTQRESSALNAPMYEYGGVKMTEYEATQRQRYNERQIRRWSRENNAMKAAGLDITESAAKLKQWRETQRDFLEQTGLKRQYDREKVFSGILPDSVPIRKFTIGRSLGAKAHNYDIFDPETGVTQHFVEGTRIQNAEVFAGRGVKAPLRDEVAEGLAEAFGGDIKDWQHAKGYGIVNVNGEHVKAEVHWFQNKTVGKVKFKVKRYLYDD